MAAGFNPGKGLPPTFGGPYDALQIRRLCGIWFPFWLMWWPQGGQAQATHASSQERGIRLDCWLEMAQTDWSSLALCCAITNLRPSAFDFLQYGGPPFYIDILNGRGQKIAARRDNANFNSRLFSNFTEWLSVGVRSDGSSLPARHTLIIAIPVTRAFETEDPANAKIVVTWVPSGLSLPIPQADNIICSLAVPGEARLISTPDSAPKPIGLRAGRSAQERIDEIPERGGMGGFFRPEIFESVSWAECIWWVIRFPLVIAGTVGLGFWILRSRGRRRKAAKECSRGQANFS